LCLMKMLFLFILPLCLMHGYIFFSSYYSHSTTNVSTDTSHTYVSSTSNATTERPCPSSTTSHSTSSSSSSGSTSFSIIHPMSTTSNETSGSQHPMITRLRAGVRKPKQFLSLTSSQVRFLLLNLLHPPLLFQCCPSLFSLLFEILVGEKQWRMNCLLF
jgi:hypothetical protein